MFLLKAIQDSYMKKDPQNEDEDSVAFVLFNVKGKDLLAIDQLNDFSDEVIPNKLEKILLPNTNNWDWLLNLSKMFSITILIPSQRHVIGILI